MEMTAAGPLRRPAEHHSDALVDAQTDAGIWSRGDPEHARADEHARHGPDDIIPLLAYLAAGYLAREGPERFDDGLRLDGVLMLSGTEPAERIIKMGEQELRIVLTVVLMQKKTRQFRDFPFFRIVRQRGRLHPGTPLSALPVAIPHAPVGPFPGPPCRSPSPKEMTSRQPSQTAAPMRAKQAGPDVHIHHKPKTGNFELCGWYSLSPCMAIVPSLPQGLRARSPARNCGHPAFPAPRPFPFCGCPASAR